MSDQGPSVITILQFPSKPMLAKREYSAESGFTLIELMVGLVISLFVSAVAMTYMVSSSRMLTNQNSEDLIQENARFAFEIMASAIRLGNSNSSTHAQAKTEGVSTEKVCTGSVECNEDSRSYTLGDPAGTGRGGRGLDYTADRIAIDYITSVGVSCTGSPITNEVKLVTVFFVDDIDGDGISSLYCQAYRGVFDTLALGYSTFNDDGAAVPLIDGVDSLQIQYGVDTDLNNNIDGYWSYNNYDAYIDGLDLIGGDVLPDVRAIRIGLLLSSGQSISTEENTLSRESRTYQLFESNYTRNDGVLRRTFSTTVYMPNSAS